MPLWEGFDLKSRTAIGARRYETIPLANRSALEGGPCESGSKWLDPELTHKAPPRSDDDPTRSFVRCHVGCYLQTVNTGWWWWGGELQRAPHTNDLG